MKIRPHKNKKTGQKCWVLDLGQVRQPDGSKKRVRQYFATRDLATGALNDSKAKREWRGDSALAISFEDASRFIAVRDQLAPFGATIEQAVAFYIKHQKPRRNPVPLAHLLNLCLEAKENLLGPGRYLAQLKSSCLSFIRGREHVMANEVTRDDVSAWILGNGWAPKTQRVYLGDLRTLFAWGLEKGYVAHNPCAPTEDGERIELAKLIPSEIVALSAEQSRALLTRCAQEGDEGNFRPLLTYVALGLFCGIRPEELARMKRGQVELKERHVIVEAGQAKTRRRRVVDISENAVAWIALDPDQTEDKKGEAITPRNFRRKWARLRMFVGWRPDLQALTKEELEKLPRVEGKPIADPSLPEWPHDAMRHTFASMHYAEHQNEALLKAQMGHSAKEEILFQHYRALKTRAEAAAFWALRPASEQ